MRNIAKALTKKSTISARVYRAKTDTWEDLGVIVGPWHLRAISRVKRTLNKIFGE